MDKYLDLAREMKKSYNIKVTVIPVIVGMLCTTSNLASHDIQ